MPLTSTAVRSDLDQWLELFEGGILHKKELPRSSSSLSVASSAESCSRHSVESGISSLSSDASLFNQQQTNGAAAACLDALYKLEQLENLDLGVKEETKKNPVDKKILSYYKKIEQKRQQQQKDDPLQLKYKNEPLKIIVGKRDILDLGSNLKSSWKTSTAQLQGGVESYFENRSQYSRLANLHPPLQFTKVCEDCGFEETIY